MIILKKKKKVIFGNVSVSFKIFSIRKRKHFMFFLAWSFLKYLVNIKKRMGAGIQRFMYPYGGK